MKHSAQQSQNFEQSKLVLKVRAYLHVHAHALFSSLGRLVRNSFTSALTVIVMAIAIALASGFYLMVMNLQQLTAGIESSNQIALFLKTNVSDNAGARLAEKIRKHEAVDKVELISKQQAMDEFKAHSGFGAALDVLDKNPLPTVLQVLPKYSMQDKHAVEQLLLEFRQQVEVDFAQLDMQWLQRLQTIMQILQRSVLIISALLGFAVLVITGNSIRLELQNRRDEVLLSKLVGATQGFIQRPFMYTGFWLGFIAGLLAWLVVTVILLVLQQPIEQLSGLYQGAFKLNFFSFAEIVSLLTLASVLGILGAWIVLFCQLRQIKPR